MTSANGSEYRERLADFRVLIVKLIEALRNEIPAEVLRDYWDGTIVDLMENTLGPENRSEDNDDD